jgi:Domain of unknown function (DUF4956)
MDPLITSLFTRPAGGELGASDFLFRLLVAWLAGQAIGWFYGQSHNLMSYSQEFAKSTVLLSMVVAVIMCVVGESLARAFGLGAALAIVRFRTPVKDSRDAMFLFSAVAAGLGAGVGMTGVALAGTGAVGAASLFLQWTGFGGRFGEEGVLRLHYVGGDAGREQIARALRRHCVSFRLAAARAPRPGEPEELLYDVNLRSASASDALVRDLADQEGVSRVLLLPQARAGEA